jgi:pyruvate kinase
MLSATQTPDPCHITPHPITPNRRERKNVNLPGVVVDLPTLTEKDVDDITNWAVPNEIDFIAASFVRKGSDIDTIRQVGLGTHRGAHHGI